MSTMKSKPFHSLLCKFKDINPIVLGHWEEKKKHLLDFDWRKILKSKFKVIKTQLIPF